MFGVLSHVGEKGAVPTCDDVAAFSDTSGRWPRRRWQHGIEKNQRTISPARASLTSCAQRCAGWLHSLRGASANLRKFHRCRSSRKRPRLHRRRRTQFHCCLPCRRRSEFSSCSTWRSSLKILQFRWSESTQTSESLRDCRFFGEPFPADSAPPLFGAAPALDFFSVV